VSETEVAQGQPTPGPWRLGAKAARSIAIEHEFEDGTRINVASAYFMYGFRPGWEGEANARLIAAAPALLAALEAARLSLSNVGAHVPADAARAAIAQVKGERPL